MSVGLYITAAYWFTASTSFANPAVTVARAFSDTFAGIRLADVPLFVAAQLIGAVCGLLAGALAAGEKTELATASNDTSQRAAMSKNCAGQLRCRTSSHRSL